MTKYTKIVVLIIIFIVAVLLQNIPNKEVYIAPEPVKVDIQTLPIEEYAEIVVSQKWGSEHWEAFYNIIEHESGWCHTKWNGQTDCPEVARTEKLPGHSNAQGLCQTMLSVHDLITDYDFMNDPYRQVDWCINYTKEKYQNPKLAWAKWQEKKWW